MAAKQSAGKQHRPTNKEATLASKVLRDPKSSKVDKKLAGGILSDRVPKKGK